MKAKSEKRRPFIGNQINECRDVSVCFSSYLCSICIIEIFLGIVLHFELPERIHFELGYSKDSLGLHVQSRVLSGQFQ